MHECNDNLKKTAQYSHCQWEAVTFVNGGCYECECLDPTLCLFPLQEVDGESLLTLDPEMMVKLMGLKTGPALRIYRKINDLKKQFGTGSNSDN